MTTKKTAIKFISNPILLYVFLGIASSLALSVVLYWALLLNSSVTSVINNTKTEPVYLWVYTLLTLGTVILFGINIPLLVHRIRKYGFPQLRSQAGAGAGTLVGIAASSCPICGSLLLSAVGITGGLAAFPLQGLELKGLSFGLMALPVWLTLKEIKNPPCDENGVCPAPKDTSLKPKDYPWLAVSLIVLIFLGITSWRMLQGDPIVVEASNNSLAPLGITVNKAKTDSDVVAQNNTALYDQVVAQVLPPAGFQSKIALGDSIPKLVANGVIDRQKFTALYQDRGGLPGGFEDILNQAANEPILLTQENANFYVNLLWALGLSNYMSTNKESPVNGSSLFNFASTGGWNLGRAENGGAYFNKFKIVTLTSEQEALVTKVAQNTYRPCCNNSTFFQDCNHGSALLGMLQLGVNQGLTEDELYREALAFNSSWFPQNYIETALYFKAVRNTDWQDVDPKLALGLDYSSISGWSKNVQAEIAKMPDLIPQNQRGGSCGT